jgi:hypothetical protein
VNRDYGKSEELGKLIKEFYLREGWGCALSVRRWKR